MPPLQLPTLSPPGTVERRPSCPPLTAAQLGDAVLPAQAVQHDADIIFGGMVLARGAADVGHDPLSWGFSSQGFDETLQC
jgi:hypothetical protein